AGHSDIPVHPADRPAHPRRVPALPLPRPGSTTSAPAPEDRGQCWQRPSLLREQARARSTRTSAETAPECYPPCAADIEIVLDPSGPSSHLDLVWHGKERGVSIDFAVRRVEQGPLVSGTARHNICGFHNPKADSLIAPGVHVAGIIDGHL